MSQDMHENSAPLKISVVIPVYGTAENLPELIQRLDSVADTNGWPTPELILVDDCGAPVSWPKLREITASRTHVHAIQLARNFGQHNAIMCGFQEATGEIVITLDDDLQHEPESIPNLISELAKHDLDVVYGVYDSKKHAIGRNLGSRAINLFFRSIFKTKVTVTSFRAIRGELLQSIRPYNLNFTWIDGLLAWTTNRIGMTTVPHHPRRVGRSSYSLSKLLTLALNVFTNFSLLPLQLVSALGSLFAVIGLGLGTFYLASSLTSLIEVPGYASTIVAILTLGGFQLLSLGIMGEYIGRIHININKKPQFVIREKTSSSIQSTGRAKK